MWAGGTFFQLCCCVSFWFWREIGYGCTYYYVLGVPYSCGVVLVFLVLAGNSFWCYVRTKCTIQLCGCVSFFVVAGKLILYEYLTVMIVQNVLDQFELKLIQIHYIQIRYIAHPPDRGLELFFPVVITIMHLPDR
jgi:hypothetical protein